MKTRTDGRVSGRCAVCGQPIRQGEQFEEVGTRAAVLGAGIASAGATGASVHADRQHIDRLHVECARKLDALIAEVSERQELWAQYMTGYYASIEE